MHLPKVQVTMGPEEVLIQDGHVSVKGQLVPEGQSWLLHGESTGGARGCPGPHVLLWDSLSTLQAGSEKEQGAVWE